MILSSPIITRCLSFGVGDIGSAQSLRGRFPISPRFSHFVSASRFSPVFSICCIFSRSSRFVESLGPCSPAGADRLNPEYRSGRSGCRLPTISTDILEHSVSASALIPMLLDELLSFLRRFPKPAAATLWAGILCSVTARRFVGCFWIVLFDLHGFIHLLSLLNGPLSWADIINGACP